MNIILFGPPGMGKSTVLGILKSYGLRAIDLEDVYPSKIRFQLPGMVDGVVLGAADLNPRRMYPNAKKVLLTADQGAYDARRKYRDDKIPGKATQTKHRVSDWLKGVKWDVIIDTTEHKSANETAKVLINFVGGKHAL